MRVIVSALVIGLVLTGTTFAQRSVGTVPSGQTTSVPPAPVGHRQPTASDVATSAPSTPEEEARKKADEKLDRALKGICRGC